MSIYVNYDEQLPKATIYAHEDQRVVKVTYRGEDGKKFAVRFVQRANPIGFMARLPGDLK
jgi:hypothetical protein